MRRITDVVEETLAAPRDSIRVALRTADVNRLHDVDAVVIGTPAHTHIEFMLEAVKSRRGENASTFHCLAESFACKSYII